MIVHENDPLPAGKTYLLCHGEHVFRPQYEDLIWIWDSRGVVWGDNVYRLQSSGLAHTVFTLVPKWRAP